MDRRVFTLSFAATLAACGKPQAPAAPTPSAEPSTPLPVVTDALVLRRVLELERAKAGLPALAGAIVRPDGELVAATGVRRKGAPETVKLSDPWHLGTATSTMTAALYARLVDQGKAKWGASVADLFPHISSIDPAWSKITIESLMQYGAGLPVESVDWISKYKYDKRPLPEQRIATAQDVLARAPPGPGGNASDSSLDFTLVGAAIEHITRTSWEDAIDTHLFKPLKMQGCGFGAPTGEAPLGHRSTNTGLLTPVPPGPEADKPAALAPASGIHAPIEAWAAFVRIFLDPKQTYLKPDTLAHLTASAPAASGLAFAGGWGIGDTPKYGKVLTRPGASDTWLTAATLAPGKQVGVILAANAGTMSAVGAVGGLTLRLLDAAAA